VCKNEHVFVNVQVNVYILYVLSLSRLRGDVEYHEYNLNKIRGVSTKHVCLNMNEIIDDYNLNKINMNIEEL
jgi:hypothetical protein